MAKRKLTLQDLERIVCEESDSDVDFEDSGSEYSTESSDDTESAPEANHNLNVPNDNESESTIQWVNVSANASQDFEPKYRYPAERDCKIFIDFFDDCNEYKVFSKIWMY